MENLQLLLVIETWALVLFCRSAQVVNHSVTSSPSQITKPIGDTAVFTCTFSDTDDQEYKRNWYKERNERQPEKITELKEKQDDRKYNISRVDSHSVKVQILNLEKNDTGKYFCGLISTSARPVIESNRSILTVTEKTNTTSESEMQEEEEEENRGRNARETALVYIGGAGLILGLAFLGFLLFIAIRRKKEEQTRAAENAPLEEDLPAASIFTVDYEILEFPRKPRPKHLPAEKTEYATIVFPHARRPQSSNTA